MSAMFPTVNLLINVSSVAVLWLGASRVNKGDIQVGTIVAYLSYLVQILMSVVMATFMVSMIPRASVVGGPHPGGARHRVVRRAAGRPGPRAAPARSPRVQGVGFHYPGAEQPVLSDISFTTTRRADDGHRRQHRRRQDDAREPHPPAVRHHRAARCWSAASTCATRSRGAVEPIGLVPQSPTCSRAPSQQPAVRQARRDRGRDVGGAEVAQAADFVRAMPGGLDARIEQGGTNVSGGQRQRLSIARALIRRPDIYVFDDSFSALDLATDARLRAALRAVHGGLRGGHRRPAGFDDRRPPTTSSCSKTARSSAAAPTTSC